MKLFTRIWGTFLSEMEWNLFLTLHFYGNYGFKSSRGVMERVFSQNCMNIDTMFFVSEYNSDFKGVHSHSLLKVNDIEKFKGSIRGLNTRCNVHLKYGDELIKDEKGQVNVGFYVSKYLDKEVDYDYFISENCNLIVK